MSRRKEKTSGRFCVGDRNFPSVGAAVSYAQNLAVHWAINHLGEERSFYVRDALDAGLYRVDLLKDGTIETWGVKVAA